MPKNKSKFKKQELKENQRVVIENVTPQVDEGRYPAKRVVGESVFVEADIFTEGHNDVMADVLYRRESSPDWKRASMSNIGNDRWQGVFHIKKQESYVFTIEAWVDRFETWQKELQKKFDASQDLRIDIAIGVNLLKGIVKDKKDKASKEINSFIKKIAKTHDAVKAAGYALDKKLLSLVQAYSDPKTVRTYDRILTVEVDRPKALFSAWYEFFPRSFGPKGKHGTLKDAEKILPEIKRMGFDVVYLPPIHPIGKTNRKGKNNSPTCQKNEPGSPWAIGNKNGGHKAIEPKLGTMKDFMHFAEAVKGQGMELAMDIAFQCSPDHPYVKEHPEWFTWRPDGTIQYAENPPKKYEDIYPINFDTEDWRALWDELKSVIIFWAEKNVRIFRIDNPHTKPFAFWKWLIEGVKKDYPDAIFLSEAFTRPKVMQQLAKVGFTQSYTYFTWRTSKRDFTEYMNELTKTDMADYFRPNFWTNTPDILAYHLQHAPRPTFIARLVLAATLSSNYGIYGPAFELCVSNPVEGKEEYWDSEKYEIKQWNWDQEGNLKDLIACMNRIRKKHAALQQTRNIEFCDISNDALICYVKKTDDLSDIIFVAVNLDPCTTQSGFVRIPLERLGINYNEPYKVTDLILKDEYTWQNDWNYIELKPHILPAHIFHIQKI